MGIENNLPYRKSASWCRGACRGAEAHGILALFQTRLSKHRNRMLARGVISSMEVRLHDLSDALDKAACDRLYAYAIEVLRQAAFVDIGEDTNFVWRCYGLIRAIWNKRYESVAKIKTNPSQFIDPVFDPDDFIGGWIRDLDKVKAESLSSYIEVLS